MIETLIATLPIVIIFGIGFLLKQTKVATSDNGSFLLKLIFFTGSPALIFLSIIRAETDQSIVKLAAFPYFIVALTLIVIFVFRKSLLKSVNPKQFGVMLLGASIMNTGFLIPFVQNFYGEEGIIRLAIVDLNNAFITFTVLYMFAVNFGGGKTNILFIIQKLLLSPPLWAILIALTIRIFEIETPQFVINTLETLARFISAAILLALGMKFTPYISNVKMLFFVVFLRFFIGAIIGLLFIKLFGLTELNAIIIILSSIAPIGMNSVTFSDLEKLDSEFAAVQVSVGLAIGMVLFPISIYILNSIYL